MLPVGLSGSQQSTRESGSWYSSCRNAAQIFFMQQEVKEVTERKERERGRERKKESKRRLVAGTTPV